VRSLSGLWNLGAFRDQFLIACLAGVLLLAGCSSTGSPNSGVLDGLFGPVASTPAPALAPEPEKRGCGTTAQCKNVLKTMIDSPDRGWIGKREAPDAYANGTRFFAYRALRKRLTCNELALAVDEVRAASQSLGGPVPGMAPDQLSRTRTLSVQVEGELAKERAGRCRV